MIALGSRVCIVMPSAIGDAVHVLPLLNAIKRRSPATKTTWIVQPGPAELVAGHPAIDELIVFDRDRGLGAYYEVRRACGARVFDVLLDLQPYFKAGILTSIVPARIKLGFDFWRARDFNWLFTNTRIPRVKGPRHIQDQFFEFLAPLGVNAEPVIWDLAPRAEERAWQASFYTGLDRPVAALVIGSSREPKNWLPERWAAVADTLTTEYGLAPVMVGGSTPREIATAHQIQTIARYPVRNALGSGLRRLVAILDGAALVVSLDTGPLHIAVALDRPVVSLIGYNDPIVYGPYRKYHDLIANGFGEPSRRMKERRLDGMMHITVPMVMDRVKLWRVRYRP
jgi:heptosyltransferase I